MASEHTFFAHRLGYRDVECEKGATMRDDEIEQDGKDEMSPFENRRRCRLAEHNGAWRSGCDISISAQVRPTIPPLDENANPPPSPSLTNSTSCSPSASLLRGQRTDSQASLACQQPWDPLSSIRQNHPAPVEGAASSFPQYSTSSFRELIDSFIEQLARLGVQDAGASRPRPSREYQSISDFAMKAVN